MTDPNAVAAPAADVSPAADVPPAPAAPESAPGRSRGWGVAVVLVVVALLAGMNAVLFVRVQKAQDRADQAAAVAGTQAQVRADLDRLDASLRAVDTTQQDASARVDTVAGQVSALRKCVNTALDAFAQATQSGKAASIAKC